MTYLKEFLNTYGMSLIHSLVLGIISYISLTIKNLYHKYLQDKTKKEVITTVCSAINQLYPNASNTDKLTRAIDYAKTILSNKGIHITDLELRLYIESSVCFLKKNNDT